LEPLVGVALSRDFFGSREVEVVVVAASAGVLASGALVKGRVGFKGRDRRHGGIRLVKLTI
jgi:hypothetical protein